MKAAAIIALIALAGSVTVKPAAAAQPGIYAGVSFATVEKDSTRSVFENEARAIYEFLEFLPAQSTSTFDSEDSAYGFVVGYRLGEHLAIEGGYLDLGDVSYRDRSDGFFGTTPESWVLNIDSGTSGIALSALGILPLSYRWEIYARGGLLLASSTETIFISNGQVADKTRPSKSGVDLLGGAGISVSVAEIYNVRLEFLRVFDAGEDVTLDEADVDMLTLGVTVAF
jgi:hypothetical protein